jgi:NitT/TauT family transport system substrate-binding protein
MNWRLGLLSLLVALGTGAGTAPGAAPRVTAAIAAPVADAALQTTPVRMGIVQGMQDAPQLLAVERGYFGEHGIRAELHNFATAVDMIPLLAAGHLETGTGSLNAGVFNAAARAIPIRVVADAGHVGPGDPPFNGIMVRKELVDSGQVRSLDDLRGRKFNMLARGSLGHIMFQLASEQSSSGLRDEDAVTISMPDTAAAMANGSVDAVFTFEPFLSNLVNSGTAVVLRSGHEVFPGHHVSVVMFAPSFADEQTDVARRWMVAYLKGVRDYNAAFVERRGLDEAAEVFVRYLPIKDPAVYRTMGVPLLRPDASVDGANVAAQQEIYVRLGLVPQPVDMARTIDNGFTQYAATQVP